MLDSVLSVGNSEQNQMYPPSIYQAQYNVVSSFLLSTLVKLFPSNPQVIDMMAPFVKVQRTKVQNGVITLEDEYRNILGAPSIYVKDDKKTQYTPEPMPTNADQWQALVAKNSSTRRPIVIVPQSEYDYLTTGDYGQPTTWDPIGYFKGPKTIQVAPVDLNSVEILYVKKEKNYVYGYILQPDDTFINDPATTVESEWESNAFEPFFKGMMNLYAAYLSDQNLQNWNQILTEKGIL